MKSKFGFFSQLESKNIIRSYEISIYLIYLQTIIWIGTEKKTINYHQYYVITDCL